MILSLVFLSLYPIIFLFGFSLPHQYLYVVKKLSLEDTYIILSMSFLSLHISFLLSNNEFLGLPLYSAYSAYVLCVKYYLKTISVEKVLRESACNLLLHTGIYSSNWIFTLMISLTLLCDIRSIISPFYIKDFDSLCSFVNVISILYSLFFLEGIFTRIISTGLLVYIHHIDNI